MRPWFKIILINKADMHDRITMRADTQIEAIELYYFMKDKFNDKYNLEVYKQYGVSSNN